MPTILRKIFQPKWQSEKAAVRLDALKNLQWEQAEQREILLRLAASDPDTQVRRAALARITDIEALCQLLAQEPESSAPEAPLQDTIAEHLAPMLEQADLQRLQQCLARLPQESQRYRLFNGLHQAERKLAALDHIHAPRLLANIAIQASASRLRQAAAERLQDQSLLDEVLKHAQNKDKGVYQIVKAKLAAYRDAEKRLQQARAEATDLCAALEAHALSDATHLYEAKYQTLCEQWQTLAQNADQDLSERATRALHTCAERVRRLHDDEQRRAREAQHQQKLQQEREATCVLLEQTLQSLRDAESPGRASLPGLDALIKTQENRWLEATQDMQVTGAEQKRYQQAMQPLRQYLSALRTFAQLELRLQELVSTGAPNSAAANAELNALLDEVQWPQGIPSPALLQQARTARHQVQDQAKQDQEGVRQHRLQVQQLGEELDRALDERSLKQSTRLFKEFQKELQQLPQSAQHEYQAGLKLLHGRLQELRDWQGFATQPKQLDLCARMEHLAAQHLDPQVKAHRIKELQDEWKALGGSSDQSLWQRFKLASDEAYKPCQAFFAEQDLLKQANLEQREKLCEQLQGFLDQVDWAHVDWKALDKINRTAREEWHRFFPVDPKRNKPIQKRFHALTEVMEGHLNEERARNAERKADIVQRAQALTQQSDLRAATQTAKALQQEWQAVGITEHREDRQLWKAFRAACDAVFAQLDAERAQHQDAVQQRILEAEKLCEELDQLQQAASETLAADLNQLQRRFAELGALPRAQSQAVQKRLQQLEQQLQNEQLQQRKEQNLALWRDLATQAEALASHEDQLIAGHAPASPPTLQLPALTPAPIQASLEQRLQRLPQTAAADYVQHEGPARLLAIEAEITAGLDSPESERAQRMEYQMGRLSAGLGGTQLQPREALIDILTRWYGLGPVPPSLRRELQERLDRAVSTILEKSLG